ncbi:hypothetical protein IED13_01155 [Bosea sp. SSUT16]|uniref:Uncharacterized protein n=1 Tax=Bosea spartocytisi TaxID=2773451 RepID=A0A927HYF0_9HYPH|nr:hypothetical protein [Bosea spartocytisi]MBD3844287.1 hypothetical protein [Bosea spartocytisi]MCT4470607.1 hypothetical protein [Bosea spartocytisi]
MSEGRNTELVSELRRWALFESARSAAVLTSAAEALADLKASEERGGRLSQELASARLRPEPGSADAGFPMGAIENGRAFADRLELTGLECPAGDLRMCSDWQEFRRCFEWLAQWALENGPAALADATKKDPGTEQREAGL